MSSLTSGLMILSAKPCCRPQIKDLGKTLAFLNQFNFLRILNLRGNPVTEEPDYRTHVILKLPQVSTGPGCCIVHI